MWCQLNITAHGWLLCLQVATRTRQKHTTSVTYELMEAIMKDTITRYLEETRIISQYQHGFISGRSCLTNLHETLECWTKALDEGAGIDVLYLHFVLSRFLSSRSYSVSSSWSSHVSTFCQRATIMDR